VRLLKGVDIRTIGSGNIGATNAARAFGKQAGLAIFVAIYLCDFAKGFLPTLLGPGWVGLADGLGTPVLVGASAVLGHCASPYLGFHGGKGVATTTGVFAALSPWPLVIAVATFFVVLALTRQVFLGSLALGSALCLGVVLQDPASAFGERLPVTLLAFAAAGLLFWTHRSNIRRFLERRSAGASAR